MDRWCRKQCRSASVDITRSVPREETCMPNFDLSGRSAFVTGATSGLGRHFAKVLAQAGASVAVSGRRPDRLESLKGEIIRAGGRCTSIVLDVTDDARIGPAFDQAEEHLGAIAVLVNN